MTGIKIPVEASMDRGNTDAVLQAFQQSINKVGASVAQANKVKYEPIAKGTLDDLKKVTAAFDNLRKINGDLNKRIKATGQSGASFGELDWDKLYSNPNSRARAMQSAFQYVVGGQFTPLPGGQPAPASGGGGGRPPPPAPPRGQVLPFPGRGVLGAGLQAMGPVGGVANGAVSAGVQGGLGAGLWGLAGGLAALAVGKAISAVREKVGAAENEAVGYDTLKRTLGDVNVGFHTLRETLRSASNDIGVTFDEGQKLGQQFVKLSGVTGEQASRELGDEVRTAGGTGRAFGMDPAVAGQFFAQMRMSGVTKDSQGSRELALLIGESVAKSGASAKSEELLQAIAGYSAQQARSGLSAPNALAYTSLLGGMVGSKMPGMDPMGAASILGRMNSAVAGGGANGEAGQNFLFAALGGGGRLNPMQVKVLQEGGMFGTGREAFGAGSAYQRGGGSLTGLEGSDVTNYELLKQQFQKNYGNNPLLMANAMGNFYGLNTRQAMAMNGMPAQQLGGVQSRLARLGIDVKDVNASGIARMGAIEADSSMSSAAKDAAMRQAAKDGQQETQGSNIRDSKVALENIQQQLATNLIPITQTMRDGILFLAGGGKKSTRQVQEDILNMNSKDRREQIEDRYKQPLKDAYDRAQLARSKYARSKPGTPEHEADRVAGEAAYAAYEKLKAQQQEELTNESKKLAEEIRTLRETLQGKTTAGGADGRGGAAREGAWRGDGGPVAAGLAKASLQKTDFDDLYKEAAAKYGVDWKDLKAMATQESGQNPNAINKGNKNGTGDYGIMQHNERYLAERGMTKESAMDPRTNIMAAAKFYKEKLDQSGGDRMGAFRRYNGVGAAAEAHAQKVEAIRRGLDTPMPEGSFAGARDQRINVEGRGSVDVNLSLNNTPYQRIPVQYSLGRPSAIPGARS